MDLNTLCLIFGALGLGSLVTIIVQYFLDKRRSNEQRVYNEKKEAYLEYITAIAESQNIAEKKGECLRSKAIARVRLVGSDYVVQMMEKAIELSTQKGVEDSLKQLYVAMRKDLKL